MQQVTTRARKVLLFCVLQVVLGFRVDAECRPVPALAARVEKALARWAEQPSAQLVFTGGRPEGKPCTEAEGMKAHALRLMGASSNDEWLVERRATSTWENAWWSLQLGSWTRVAVVTNQFHSGRAARAFRRAAAELNRTASSGTS